MHTAVFLVCYCAYSTLHGILDEQPTHLWM